MQDRQSLRHGPLPRHGRRLAASRPGRDGCKQEQAFYVAVVGRSGERRATWSSRPAALLTFDGCYSDQLENAVPVLDAVKFPATFFPASAGLACELPDAAAYWRNTVLALTKAGHTVGCHTHNHPVLTRLS